MPAAVTIAQAIDESNWGQSSLASEDHNLFGIKGTGPAGTVSLPTHEVYNGETVSITAQFRVYDDLGQSIDDHGKLLADSGAYTTAMASRNSPNSFANALTGVYATDPSYGTSLISLMRQYNLYRYDASASRPAPRRPAPRPPRPAPSPSRTGPPSPTRPPAASHGAAPGQCQPASGQPQSGGQGHLPRAWPPPRCRRPRGPARPPPVDAAVQRGVAVDLGVPDARDGSVPVGLAPGHGAAPVRHPERSGTGEGLRRRRPDPHLRAAGLPDPAAQAPASDPTGNGSAESGNSSAGADGGPTSAKSAGSLGGAEIPGIPDGVVHRQRREPRQHLGHR